MKNYYGFHIEPLYCVAVFLRENGDPRDIGQMVLDSLPPDPVLRFYSIAWVDQAQEEVNEWLNTHCIRHGKKTEI